MALVGLLSRKGVVPYQEFMEAVHRLEGVDHGAGARVVAHAWSDPQYKDRLLADPRAAVGELGVEIAGYDELQVVENTERVHHVVVCTTCSCVPSPLSGFTPDWYKSAAYRNRVIGQTREVLREFGLELPGGGGAARDRHGRAPPLHGAPPAPGAGGRPQRGAAGRPGDPGEPVRRGPAHQPGRKPDGVRAAEPHLTILVRWRPHRCPS